MNEPCLVDWCDRPVGDGYCCASCGEKLAVALGDIPALWEELDIVLTRQALYETTEGRGGETALMFNAAASELGWVLRNTLSTWCRLISEERGKPLPEDNIPAMARWMLNHVSWVRHQRAGHEVIEEIKSIVDKIRGAIDRPAPKLYAGPCPDCQQDMYGPPDATSVECRPCGVSYPVDVMVAKMNEQLRGKLVTAREATILLARAGYEISQKTIEKWHLRERITAHGHDRSGVRLYLFDEIRSLTKRDTPPLEAAS